MKTHFFKLISIGFLGLLFCNIGCANYEGKFHNSSLSLSESNNPHPSYSNEGNNVRLPNTNRGLAAIQAEMEALQAELRDSFKDYQEELIKLQSTARGKLSRDSFNLKINDFRIENIEKIKELKRLQRLASEEKTRLEGALQAKETELNEEKRQKEGEITQKDNELIEAQRQKEGEIASLQSKISQKNSEIQEEKRSSSQEKTRLEGLISQKDNELSEAQRLASEEKIKLEKALKKAEAKALLLKVIVNAKESAKYAKEKNLISAQQSAKEVAYNAKLAHLKLKGINPEAAEYAGNAAQWAESVAEYAGNAAEWAESVAEYAGNAAEWAESVPECAESAAEWAEKAAKHAQKALNLLEGKN